MSGNERNTGLDPGMLNSLKAIPMKVEISVINEATTCFDCTEPSLRSILFHLFRLVHLFHTLFVFLYPGVQLSSISKPRSLFLLFTFSIFHLFRSFHLSTFFTFPLFSLHFFHLFQLLSFRFSIHPTFPLVFSNFYLLYFFRPPEIIPPFIYQFGDFSTMHVTLHI